MLKKRNWKRQASRRTRRRGIRILDTFKVSLRPAQAAAPLLLRREGEETEDVPGGWLAEARVRARELIVPTLFFGLSTPQVKRRRNRHKSSHHKQVVWKQESVVTGDDLYDFMLGPQLQMRGTRSVKSHKITLLNSRGRRIARRALNLRPVSYRRIRAGLMLYDSPPESLVSSWVRQWGRREVDATVAELKMERAMAWKEHKKYVESRRPKRVEVGRPGYTPATDNEVRLLDAGLFTRGYIRYLLENRALWLQ